MNDLIMAINNLRQRFLRAKMNSFKVLISENVKAPNSRGFRLGSMGPKDKQIRTLIQNYSARVFLSCLACCWCMISTRNCYDHDFGQGTLWPRADQVNI